MVLIVQARKSLHIGDRKLRFTPEPAFDGLQCGIFDQSDLQNLRYARSIYKTHSPPKSDSQVPIFTIWVGDSATGFELWKSDGTPEGTDVYADIVAGPDSSYPGILG